LIPGFREVVDLTNVLEDGMPYYPGDPEPRVRVWKTLERDGVNLKELHLGTHSGTHVDAPLHFLREGAGVDSLDPMAYSGEAIAVSTVGHTEIPPSFIPDSPPPVILFYTGYSERWGRGLAIREYPYLGVEAAEEIVRKGVRVVGIDSPSVEKPGSRTPQVHIKLLGSGVLIVENLSKNLARLVGKRFYFLCLPLPIRGGDGGAG